MRPRVSERRTSPTGGRRRFFSVRISRERPFRWKSELKILLRIPPLCGDDVSSRDGNVHHPLLRHINGTKNNQEERIMRIITTLSFLSVCLAYQPQKPVRPALSPSWLQEKARAPLAAIALSLLVVNTQPALASTASLTASDTAAQISLNSIPPNSVSVQIKDLPVIGKLASGVYSKVPDSIEIKKPSIVIQSPKDKSKAIQNIVKTGHLEFDVSGVISTHLDIDVAAEKAGVMNVRIASDLIPKLPFKNAASFAGASVPTGGKESPWNMVMNMGTGEVYYYNEKSGVTQYTKPSL
eukprot:scaffold6915_cov170-Amphora_coffeaeformis.AAC.11